jgi:predicted metal-dependent hydrolase
MRKLNLYIVEKLKLNKNTTDIYEKVDILIKFLCKDHPEMAKAFKKYVKEHNFYDFITYVQILRGDENVYDEIKDKLDIIDDHDKCDQLFDEIDPMKDLIYYKKFGTAHIENIWAHDDMISIWAAKMSNTDRLNIFLIKDE